MVKRTLILRIITCFPEKVNPHSKLHFLPLKGHERAEALIGYFTKREEIVNLLQSYPLAGIFAQGKKLKYQVLIINLYRR